MKSSRRLVLLLAGALASGSFAVPLTSVAPAEARESRPLFSLPKQLRLPWSQPSRPTRKARRASRSVRSAPPPLPRPAPRPDETRPAAAQDAASGGDAAPSSGADDDARAAERAAGFAALRPAAETPPLPPLVRPPSRAVNTAPLPPERPTAVAALPPRAPLTEAPPADTPPVEAPAPSARDRDPDCAALADAATAAPLPPILGPGACGAALPVSLSAVKLPDGSEVTVTPAATLTCAAALAATQLVRDDLAPAAKKAGARLSGVSVAASYVCRGRNNRKGAKMSEHGLANALDVSGFSFTDGRRMGVYDDALPKGFADALKPAVCARFMTVLGQGSDGFHEDHLHLDLRKRRNPKSKLCQWTVD
ncbi:hypothetical protein GCM10008171_03920 [Methylopila jiangsuensis]|uniref:Extensin-like C-terminal domain-containing protein n=1 Tax=Methylopila jiangsuensis TaxID=586230 RepID=A0A9W6JF41_9HYPH|nr:extensin family protein [Methylopila jiangsuensis]MDR6285382.1 hypothetical protein [Methylopila jiangsuensis]GLK75138.1 hypothetical protein GCM10008171_03920 [Methylopila jiangsuensis]